MKNAARQLIDWTSRPPMNGPRMLVAADAPAQMPKTRPRCSPSKLEVISDSDPGTRRAPVAPWAMRAMMRNSMFGERPHRIEVMPNPVSPTANIRRRPK